MAGLPRTVTKAEATSGAHNRAETTKPTPPATTRLRIMTTMAPARVTARASENPRITPRVDRRPKRTMDGPGVGVAVDMGAVPFGWLVRLEW